MSIVADVCRQSKLPMVPACGHVHAAGGHKPRRERGHRIHRLCTMTVALVLVLMLVLETAGSLIIPGTGASLTPGGPISTGSVVTTVAASAGPALSFHQLGNCPGGSIPCP